MLLAIQDLTLLHACLRLQFLDVEINPILQCPVPAVCIILCSNVQSLAVNLSDLTVVTSHYC